MSHVPSSTRSPATTDDMHDHSLMSLSFATFLLAIVLFITSLFLPVFITQTHDILGYWVLAMGWLGFVAFQFAWYAAPFAVLAVYISRKSPQFGLVLSVIAILMASEAFLFTEVPFGKNDKVLDYGSGFYVWYLCFYLVSFSILLRLIAWGKIEEESSSINPNNPSPDFPPEVRLEDQSFQQDPVRTVPVKARRRIVAQKEKSQKKKSLNWKKRMPPPLPMKLAAKNIYSPKEIKTSGEKNKENITEKMTAPPLKTKKRSSIKPPSLPKWYKSVISRPPPLPVKTLGVAPFLDK